MIEPPTLVLLLLSRQGPCFDRASGSGLDTFCMVANYAVPTGVQLGGVPFTLGVRYDEVAVGYDAPDQPVTPGRDPFLLFVGAIVYWHVCARAAALTCFTWHVMLRRFLVLRSMRDESARGGCAVAGLVARLVLVALVHAFLAFYWGSTFTSRPTFTWDLPYSSFDDGSELGDCLMQMGLNASCAFSTELGRTANHPNRTRTWIDGLETAGWSREYPKNFGCNRCWTKS